MALPQIPETDPWLEDDEENMESREYEDKIAWEKLENAKRIERKSFTVTVTAIAKISIYSYLIFKILSNSKAGQIVFYNLKHLAGKYKSLSSIIFILLLSLVGYFKH